MSTILDRLPPLATTGVGSLPFTNPADAARHATSAYTLPFCPQLPRRDGDMVSEWLGSDPCRCGWSPDRDRERPAAWDRFLAQVEAQPPDHATVKLQVTGPLTLALALGAVSLAREIAVWLAANAAGQVRRLADLGLDALLVVDEPGLVHAGVSAADADLWDPLRAAAPAWGMHVCGRVPWPLVDTLDLDVISFDVRTYGIPAAARPVLATLLRRGGRIAWGVIDPVAPEPAGEAIGRSAACLAALGLPLDRIARQSLLTPSCGTGRLTPERERHIAGTLETAARSTRDAIAALGPVRATARTGPPVRVD